MHRDMAITPPIKNTPPPKYKVNNHSSVACYAGTRATVKYAKEQLLNIVWDKSSNAISKNTIINTMMKIASSIPILIDIKISTPMIRTFAISKPVVPPIKIDLSFSVFPPSMVKIIRAKNAGHPL